MSDMDKATISVRELQQNLKKVLARVERGQVVEVTRRRRAVARLSPLHDAAPDAWPDLQARTREVFGTRRLVSGGVTAVLDGRGDR